MANSSELNLGLTSAEWVELARLKGQDLPTAERRQGEARGLIEDVARHRPGSYSANALSLLDTQLRRAESQVERWSRFSDIGDVGSVDDELRELVIPVALSRPFH
jgi:hypothetical protein